MPHGFFCQNPGRFSNSVERLDSLSSSTQLDALRRSELTLAILPGMESLPWRWSFPVTAQAPVVLWALSTKGIGLSTHDCIGFLRRN